MSSRWLLALLALAACEPEETPPETETCAGSGVICTYMGTGEAGLGHDGVKPTEVRLYLPQDLAFDADGAPYVLDWNNHRVRTVRDGLVETYIGTGELGDAPAGVPTQIPLNHPTHLQFGPDGLLYLSAWHNSKVMVMDQAADYIEPYCGTGGRAYAGDGGPALTAVLDLPVATAFDVDGRLLIADQANQRIRRVGVDGVIDTVVGPPKSWLPATLTRVCATDEAGTETCKVCKVDEAADPACAVQPVPKPQGFAGDGGPATAAMLYLPFSQSAPPAGRITMGDDGTLYLCDTGNQRVRAVGLDGIIRTVAGSGPEAYDPTYAGGYSGDGGPATAAQLQNPTDVALDAEGNLYIADTGNHCVRKVDNAGTITTFAGVCGSRGFDGDGGAPDAALLDRPYGIAFDPAGNLYIADTHNHRIRVVYY